MPHQLGSAAIKRVRAVLPAVCGIGIAAVGGWLVAGGGMPSVEPLFGDVAPAAAGSSAGGAPVHLDSTPSGAAVRINGASRGKTPLDIWLSPGHHVLSLQHPDAIDDEQVLQVADSGASVDIALWRRRPEVLPLRPVYPGAWLIDARFLDDGQVALLVATPARSGPAGAGRELWRLDPTTAQLTRVTLPGEGGPTSTIVLAPDGEQVAYVKPGDSSDLSASLWPKTGSATARQQQELQAESVWLAPLDGSQQARRIFTLPSESGPAAPSAPERIVDLMWTPDRFAAGSDHAPGRHARTVARVRRERSQLGGARRSPRSGAGAGAPACRDHAALCCTRSCRANTLLKDFRGLGGALKPLAISFQLSACCRLS